MLESFKNHAIRQKKSKRRKRGLVRISSHSSPHVGPADPGTGALLFYELPFTVMHWDENSDYSISK